METIKRQQAAARAPRRRSMQFKLGLLLIGSILAVAMGLMLISYYFFCQRADARFNRAMESAVVAAAANVEPRVIKNYWSEINTDEFRAVHERAVAANDEQIIVDWMKSLPGIDAKTMDEAPLPVHCHKPR